MRDISIGNSSIIEIILSSKLVYYYPGEPSTQSLYVGGRSSNPSGISFNNTGSKMYILGNNNTSIYSYILTTPYDISTSSYNTSFSVSSESSNPLGMAWNNDGSEMYISGNTNSYVYSYTLSTPYNISTSTYNTSFDVSSQSAHPNYVTFNDDGSKMYTAIDFDSRVVSYTLTTPYDISTSTYNQTKDVQQHTQSLRAISFNGDGSKMYVTDYLNASVNVYTLDSYYDISTSSFDKLLYIHGSYRDGQPNAMAWNNNGSKMYIVDTYYNRVYSYPSTHESEYSSITI